MAEENGYNPEPEEEPEKDQPQDNDETYAQRLAFVQSLVDGLIDQRLQDLVPEVVQGVTANVVTAVNAQLAQLTAQAPAPTPVVQPAVPQETAAPKFNVGELLGNPEQLGSLANTLFDSIAHFRNAFKPDPAQVLREIAAQHPHLMMAYAPDPYGGMFPRVMADTYLKGLQVAWSALGAATGAPLPGRYGNPSGLPGGTSPGGDAGPMPTPAPTTGPSPTPGGSGTAAVTSQSYDHLPDATIDHILTELMEVRALRDLARQKISVVA